MSITPTGRGWFKLDNGKKVRGREKAEAANRQVEAVTAHLGIIAGRAELARKVGLQYQGKRDVYTVAGYIVPGAETFSDYASRYERDATAGRIVDMAPQATWKKPPAIVEEGMEEGGTEFTKAWKKLEKRLSLFSMFNRADKLARIGRYGAFLIGVKGEDLKLKDPLPQLSGPDDVIFVSPFHEKAAAIDTLETDTSNERYGQPKTYKLDLSDGNSGSTQEVVHWSRMIHIAENLLENEIYGRPVLKRLLNPLMDLEKVTASTGESFWQLAARILTAEIDPDSTISPEQIKELGENLEEMVHDLRRQSVMQGGKIGWVESTPPDPKEAANLFMMLLAAGAPMPKRILFGTETGERASEQDERQWLGSISERQTQFAEPTILRAFIDRMIKHKGLPTPKDEYDAVWPPLFQESDKEIAEGNKARADAAKALTPIGGSPMELGTVDEDGNFWLTPTKEGDEVVTEPKGDEVDPEGEDPDLGDADSTTLEEV